MVDFVVFLHVLSAIALGFYLFLPFLLMRVGKLSSQVQEGFVITMLSACRISQYVLVVQFLTGGYLLSQSEYTVAWIVSVIVLFIVTAALSGIMCRPLRKLVANAKSGMSITMELRKAKNLSIIVSILLLVIIVLMNYPMYR